MKKTFMLLISLIVVATLALSGAGAQEGGIENGQNMTMPNATGPNQTVNAIPPEIVQHADEWPLPHKDYNNSRATTDVAINASNVNTLRVTWTFRIPGVGPYGAAASNPVILNDTVYFQDLDSNIFALRLQNGGTVWERRYNETAIGPNGPAVGYNTVFAQGGVNQLRALNRTTGAEIWSAILDGPTGVQQPMVYNGSVFTGTGAGAVIEQVEAGQIAYRGYAGNTSGYVYAVDAETGNITWRFQTVEEGFWGNPEVNSGGGIWYTPAIDPETGVTFWGTGNPAPFPGTAEYPNGASRPGPNLYTNSMLALDHGSGQLVWYNQVKPHDLFDHDFQVPKILTTANVDGAEQEIVIGAGKLGRVIAFDRQNGTILWDSQVGRHKNDQLQRIPEDRVINVMPSVYGGVETPMALAADGMLYVPVIDVDSPYNATGFNASNGTEAVINAEARTNLSRATSSLVAIDVDTGAILWERRFDGANFGGATVINDLVFTATFDGTIYALNRTNGGELWNYTAPAGINAWPAVADNTIIWPCGVGANASLIAFRLGAGQPPMPNVTPGTMPNLTPNATPAPGLAQQNTTTTLVARGNAFDRNTITVPAGAQVTIRLDNQDLGIPHNVAVYTSPAATNTIFRGNIITGISSTNYTFRAPNTPGTYFFRCDIHPTTMTGQFVVQ
jgi:glucose dehydrogenase/plastocyanin